MIRVIVLLLLATMSSGSSGSGCSFGPEDDCTSSVEGTAADSRIVAEDRNGFSIQPCQRGNGFLVIGHGDLLYDDCGESDSSCRFDALRVFVNDVLSPVVSDRESVWSVGGGGLACRDDAPGVWTYVIMDDWRDLDGVVEDIGAALAEHQLGEIVSVQVESIPCPA
jgi:hypothetical protein